MRVLTALGTLVFIGCLLGGIGYSIAVLSFSGEPVATITHPDTEGIHTAPLDLSPEMNPLRAIMDVEYSQTLGSAELFATVTLRSPDGTTAWSQRRRVTTTGEGGIGGSTSASLPVERFEVPVAGRFQMDIHLDDDLGAHFVSVAINVRRNVRLLDWTLLIGLTVTGLLGLGLAVGAQAMSDRRSERTP